MTVDVISFRDAEVQVIRVDEEVTRVITMETAVDTISQITVDSVATVDTSTDVVSIGIQGPPSAQTAVWTYVQEGVPAGGEGFTWFEPSTGYGYVWITGLASWQRFLVEHMTADDNNHGIEANGGYF